MSNSATQKFDAIFHLASITDTTNHNQFEQVHDNVESFRRILNFARPTKLESFTRRLLRLTARPGKPAWNQTAPHRRTSTRFPKRSWTTSPRARRGEHPDWIIVGLRYFNVYGPREAHKGVPASMIYHLAQQIKAGQRPRIFKHGEQKRDFVYVKDVVEGSIRALEATQSGIFNLGSGQARSFNELVDILNKSLGTNFPPDYIDNPHAHYQNFTQADLSRAQQRARYEPQFALEAGRSRLHAVALRKLTAVWPNRPKSASFRNACSDNWNSCQSSIDSGAEALIKFDPALVPFRHPPLDHPATVRTASRATAFIRSSPIRLLR